jgi:hypothetical protein
MSKFMVIFTMAASRMRVSLGNGENVVVHLGDFSPPNVEVDNRLMEIVPDPSPNN